MTVIDRIIELLGYSAGLDRPRRMLLSLVGGSLFGMGLLTVFKTARALDRRLPLRLPLALPARLALGLPLMVFGTGLAGWSLWLFFKAHGTPVPLNPPAELVTDGPFAVTRNPIVTAMFLTTAGLGIMLGSPSLLTGLPLVMTLLGLEIRYIEEPELERRFGESYRQYRRRVPAFLPLPR